MHHAVGSNLVPGRLPTCLNERGDQPPPPVCREIACQQSTDMTGNPFKSLHSIKPRVKTGGPVSELRGYVKEEVDILSSTSLTDRMASADVKQH